MLQNQKSAMKSVKEFDTKSIIKYAVQSILPKSAGSQDVDLIVRLCIMAAVPTGDENPHDLVREMSDGVINAFVQNIEIIRKTPISAPVAQFFFLEWCWRQGHLNADWKWEWDASNEGHASYSPKESMDSLLMKAEASPASMNLAS